MKVFKLAGRFTWSDSFWKVSLALGLGLLVGCPGTQFPPICSSDAECDDGVECTLDTCTALGICVQDSIGCVGAAGTAGANGLGVQVTDRHGTDWLLSTGDFETAGKFFASASITSATATPSGVVTVNFTVQDEMEFPVVGVAGVDFKT